MFFGVFRNEAFDATLRVKMKTAPRSVRQSCLRAEIIFPHIGLGPADKLRRKARKQAKRLSSKEGRHLDAKAVREELS